MAIAMELEWFRRANNMIITIYESDFRDHSDDHESLFFGILVQLDLAEWNGKETVLTSKGVNKFGDIDIAGIDSIDLKIEEVI